MVLRALPRSIWIVASLLLLAGRALAQDEGGSDLDVTEIQPRGSDSVRYQVTWAPEDIADKAPSLHYLVQLLLGKQTVVSHEIAPNRAADTLSVALPTDGDSLGPLLIRVRAVNRGGKTSDWVESNPWWLRLGTSPTAVAVAEADSAGPEEGDSVAAPSTEAGDSASAEAGDSLAEAGEPGDALAQQAGEPADSAPEPAEPDASADAARPELRAGALNGELVALDGVLSEPVWSTADSITGLTMIEPEEGGVPAGRTVVKVLRSPDYIIVGARCYDPDPRGIVSFSKARDSDLENEDHIVLVFDTFRDERSGYVFAVNPSGARFDGLVSARGEEVNSDWDAIWEARTSRDSNGWTAEVRIPIKSISFSKDQTSWGFNVQRRVQRLQETDRWSGPDIDDEIYQTSEAGLLTEVSGFDLGLGLSIRPAVIGGTNRSDPDATTDATGDASLDVTQRLGPNLLASLTINTDFAETETDARQTNLSRFDILFPEKRSFFLEGSDIFDFGLGLDEANLVPFFSRRVGLVNPEEGESDKIPIIGGLKVNGRIGETNVGSLVMRTNNVDRLGVPEATMGAVRIKQNVLQQSTVGMIATFGDPLGRGGSWLAGVDATYQTSEFLGDKNLLVGVWGLRNDRDGLEGNKNAYGGRVDFPNDLVGFGMTFITIGDGVQPSLGFAPRTGVRLYEAGVDYNPRPSWGFVRQMFHELGLVLYTDLDNRWESYEVKINPLDWQLESGDRVTFKILPSGDRPPEDFDVFESPTETVTIPAGSYNWTRYRVEGASAEKRMITAEIAHEFGHFYDGNLKTIESAVTFKPWPVLTVELSGERNSGALQSGDFTQYLFGGRVEVKPSADFQIGSFVQYDNESRSLGTNTRLRWTFNPLGDLFVVYNHNMQRSLGSRQRFNFDSNQLLVKVQYALRF